MADKVEAPAQSAPADAFALRLAMVRAVMTVNPGASGREVVEWAFSELRNLYAWVDMLSCCRSGVQLDTGEVFGMLEERLAPILAAMDTALESKCCGGAMPLHAGTSASTTSGRA